LKVPQAVGAEQDDAETQYHQDGDTKKETVSAWALNLTSNIFSCTTLAPQRSCLNGRTPEQIH